MQRLPFGCAALALAAAAAPAQAEAPPAAVSPVTVTARDAGSPTQPDVGGQRKALDRIAGSVTLLDAAAFQDRYAYTLRDVLKDAPGVLVETRYGQELRLSIRGSGVGRSFHTRGIEVAQDGVPWNLADGSGDFYAIDPLSLQSIEVLKGGNALRFGSSTLGGAINAVTPTARTLDGAGRLRVDGGSYGSVRGSATLGRAAGEWDALATVTAFRADGFRDHSAGRGVWLNANVGRRLGEGAETRLYLSVNDTRQQLPGTLPLSVALSSPTSANPATAGSGPGGNQQRNQANQRLASRTAFRLGSGQGIVDLWVQHKSLHHPIFQVLAQDGWTWGADARWNGRADLGRLGNEVVAGVRATTGDNRARQYLNLSGRRVGAATADAIQRASNLDLYAEDRLSLTPTLTLTAGAKYAVNQRDLENRFAPARSAEKTYSGLSPRLGLLWQATPALQVFADLTRSRDVPDFTDLAQASPFVVQFVPLQPQRAWTGEVGARGRLGPATLDLTLYRAEIRGELLQFTVDPSIPAATFNAGRTVHQGVEASARVQLARDLSGDGVKDRLSVFGLWSHNDFRFDRDRVYGRNRIAGTPPDVMRLELRYERPRLGVLRDVYLAPQLDWVPQGAWADQANTLRAPGYALAGLEAGASLPSGLGLFVEARNLTDERYVSDISVITDARRAGTSIFYPGEGRSVFAGLRHAF